AQMIAVVAQEDDQRPLCKSQTIQRVEDSPQLGVDEGNTRVVGALELQPLGVCEFGEGRAELSESNRQRRGRRQVLGVAVERDGARRIKIEVLFRCDKWVVRLMKSQADEPGLIAQLFHERNGLTSVLTVGLVIVTAGSHTPVAPAQHAAGEVAALNDLSSRCGLIGVRFVPRYGQIHPTLLGGLVPPAAEMKNLAKCGCVVAVLSEQLGQR